MPEVGGADLGGCLSPAALGGGAGEAPGLAWEEEGAGLGACLFGLEAWFAFLEIAPEANWLEASFVFLIAIFFLRESLRDLAKAKASACISSGSCSMGSTGNWTCFPRKVLGAGLSLSVVEADEAASAKVL